MQSVNEKEIPKVSYGLVLCFCGQEYLVSIYMWDRKMELHSHACLLDKKIWKQQKNVDGKFIFTTPKVYATPIV